MHQISSIKKHDRLINKAPNGILTSHISSNSKIAITKIKTSFLNWYELMVQLHFDIMHKEKNAGENMIKMRLNK